MVENLPDCKVSNPTLAEVAERGFSVLLEPVLNKKFRREQQAILVGEGTENWICGNSVQTVLTSQPVRGTGGGSETPATRGMGVSGRCGLGEFVSLRTVPLEGKGRDQAMDFSLISTV